LILDRYRLQETRGHGGFARVDIAWDNRLRRRVALKRIPLRVAETDLPGIEEARTAALLEDPHIVAVYDFVTTGTEAILIMENVDGPTLAELMAAQEELLGLDTIAAILSPIAQALEHAHENQVLHLDIKPANILINHQGNIKVTDFGMAELSSTAGFSEAQGGTIGYMPPEQIELGNIDERTDLWALAALAYQLICGRNPFFATSPEESLRLIINTPIPLPTVLRPELEPGINDVLVGALNAEKDERPAKVRNFWRALAPYLGKTATGRKNLRALVLGLAAADDPEADALAAESLDGHEGGAGTAGGTGSKTATNTQTAVEEDDATSSGARRGFWQRDFAEEPPPPAPEPAPPGVPLWDRVAPRARTLLARLLAALACGASAWLAASSLRWAGGSGSAPGAAEVADAVKDAAQASEALSSLTPLAAPLDGLFAVQLLVSLLVALSALLAPSLGAALVVVALAGACFIAGYPLLGVAVTLGLAAWWVCCGRRSVADATIFALAPLVATFGLPFLLPLLAGAFLPWRRALGTTGAALGLLAALGPLTASTGSLGLILPLHASLAFANPGTLGTAFDLALYKPYVLAFGDVAIWLALASGLLGALTSAFVCKRATRAACAVGSLLATAIISAGTIVPAVGLLTDAGLTRAIAEAASLAVSCGLLCLMAAAGIAPASDER
jgi:hypothetical protein